MCLSVSVTEEEIQEGILLKGSIVDRTLCYTRNLHGIKEDESNSTALKRYIELDDNATEHKHSFYLLEDLKTIKIPDKVPPSNRKNYDIVWTGTSLEKSKDPKHSQYIDNFCDDFVDDMKTIISKEISKNEQISRKSQVVTEALHHAKFCKRKCEIFCGQENIILSVIKYVQEPNESHLPLVIYGKSGFGKTTLLAHVASNLQKWVRTDLVLVVRFLGTSPSSSTLKMMILSVMQQLCEVFSLHEDFKNISPLESIGDLKTAFWSMLNRLSEHHLENKSLVIILDSIDQLSKALGAHEMLWLPKQLPHNVFVILSMLSDRYSCLEAAKKRFTLESNFIEIRPLPLTTGREIISAYMSKEGRQLKRTQEEVLLQAFKMCSQPLFLKLLLDDAKTWKSYIDLQTLVVPKDVHDAVHQLFKKCEDKYGAIFVSSALGFITCGQAGLTEVELEDALSCDNDVLNEVYQYHDPPLPDIIRVPPLMWSRLQYDVSEYLVERQADGKTVISWYHRVFWEAAEERYLHFNSKIRLHSSLAEIFRKDDGFKKTITLEKRNNLVIENADRQISHQPLKQSNLRKLNCLPYHLFNSEQFAELKEKCLLNFHWLMIKLKALTISYVFGEYDAFCSLWKDEECQLMLDFLQLSYEALQIDPHLLAYQTLERLDVLSQTNHAFSLFMAQAKEWIENTDTPLLIPVHSTEAMKPAGPLQFSLNIGNHGFVTSDGKKAVSMFADKKSSTYHLQIWDLENKDMIESISTVADSCYSTSGDEKTVLLCEECILRIFDIQSGDLVKEVRYCSRPYDKWDIKSVVSDNSGNVVAVGARLGIENHDRRNRKDKRYSYQSTIFLIDVPSGRTEEILRNNERQLQKVMITPDDQSLISIDFEEICVYELKTCKVKFVSSVWKENSPTNFQFAVNSPLLIGICGGFHERQASVCFLNYVSGTSNVVSLFRENQPTKNSSQIMWHVFDSYIDEHFSKIIVGLSTSGKYKDNKLALHDIALDKVSLFDIKSRGEKSPTRVCALDDFILLMICWLDGLMSFYDTVSQQTLMEIRGHEMSISYVKVGTSHDSLFTIGADKCLKVWNIVKLITESRVANTTSAKNLSTKEEVRKLTSSDESVAVVCTNETVVTAEASPYLPPTFWNISDGSFCPTLSKCSSAIYRDLFYNSQESDSRKYVLLKLSKDEKRLVDIRKTQAEVQFHILDLSEDISLKNNFNCTNPYVLLNCSSVAVPSNGHMTVLDCQTSEVLQKISISPWPKKLVKYGISSPPIITESRCEGYLLFASVVIDPKYMEVIDLIKGKVISKASLPQTTTGFLQDSFYYLVVYDETNCEVLGPKDVPKHNSPILNVLLQSQFLSADGSKGVRLLNNSTDVEIWDVPSCTLLQVLSGHQRKAHAVSFSPDGRFLMCGAYCTATLWHVATGALLHSVYIPSPIYSILFSPNLNHVIVQCYAAPRYYRVIIHKTHHLEKFT